jgi:NifU-like protein involved in Fe-S cluster formation
MRTSILTRSVITTASLAIASVALVAAPAVAKPAATPEGVTREKVLAAAATFRAQDEATYVTGLKTVSGILHRACAIDIDSGEVIQDFYPIPVEPPVNADGVVILGFIGNNFDNTYRLCVVGAVAATDPGFALQGSATLTAGTKTVTVPLAGDVTTSRIDLIDQDINAVTFSAAGSSVKISTTTTSTKVADKKTKVEKKRAKSAYDKKLKAAKKTYTRALDKAGRSKSKKAAAKKAYAAKKASAKAAYRYAIASYRIVQKTTSTADSRPFTLTMLQGPS